MATAQFATVPIANSQPLLAAYSAQKDVVIVLYSSMYVNVFSTDGKQIRQIPMTVASRNNYYIYSVIVQRVSVTGTVVWAIVYDASCAAFYTTPPVMGQM